MKLRRSGTSLTVTWTKSERAARYGIRVETTDGRALFFVRGRGVRYPGSYLTPYRRA